MIKTIFLASSSPRRKDLLKQISFNLKMQVKILRPYQEINMEKLEIPNYDESPSKYVRRVALKKATTSAEWMLANNKKYHLILAADTTVAFNNKILSKPNTKKEAFNMLRMLSNQSHKVMTSVVIVHNPEKNICQNKPKIYQFCKCSTVWLGHVHEPWLKSYVESGEPMDKSGGYGIQGKGQEIVRKINGSYSGIMGLPLFETLEVLQKIKLKN
ncbi:MAG: septum formation protein Maf [Betaproteobacteria bacterium TMED41]|nr:MAG: septum formation protein Maf [Betaproteobacteria bacterium TMED41]|tara:strand:+ start:151 stop:792 length:642 start_codon:yes stop_codon:yes gene_type:complete